MGSFFSSIANPSPLPDDGDSAVVAVHSQASWDAHWESHKASNKLLVIDFTASWCGPCRSIEPVFRAFSAKYEDVAFVKIDVDELSGLAAQWKVQAMPTFVLVKGGKEVGRVVGAQKDELERNIVRLRG